MSKKELRRPASRWTLLPRVLLFAAAVVAVLGVFVGLIAGVAAMRFAMERAGDDDWRPPTDAGAQIAAAGPSTSSTTPDQPATDPVRPAAVRTPQRVALWSMEAKLHGKGIRFTGKRDKVIGNWSDPDAWAEWSLDPAAGEYHVDVTYASRGGEGGAFAVEVAGRRVMGRAGRTPGKNTYTTVRLPGTVTLPEGPTTLTVKPTERSKRSLMTLLRVDLQPSGADAGAPPVVIAQALEPDDEDARMREGGDDADNEAEEKAERARERREREREQRAEREERIREKREREREARKQKERERREERARQAALAAARPKPPAPVRALMLIDAATGKVLERLSDGATVNLAKLPPGRLSVRAEVGGRPGSVRFGYNGDDDFWTEDNAPFTVRGDDEGENIRPWDLPPGEHQLTATAFAGPGATGPAAPELAVKFEVVDRPADLPDGGAVTALTVVDADRGTPLRPLVERTTLDLGALPAERLAIRADVGGEVGSVRFELREAQRADHTEDDPPYALNGDRDGRHWPAELKPGRYRLTATPFTEDGAKGKRGKPLSVRFEIREGRGGDRDKEGDGRPDPDGAIVLDASDAKVHGDGIRRVEGTEPLIGYWDGRDAYPEWRIPRPSAGEYQVELTYAVPDGAGGEFVVTVGEGDGAPTLRGRTEPTGDWGRYRTRRVGTLNLKGGDDNGDDERGEITVTVRPTPDLRRALMNLREVKLVPVSDED